jgi:enoyl-CoA hydratase/carnithine racemase
VEDVLETEAIQFEIGDDHVATITLDRPAAMNSFNDVMAREMAWAWTTVRDNDEVHAVVLRGNGDRAFSTGADIKGGATWFFSSNVWNTFDPGETLSPKQHHHCWKPVVAAVHGMCAGGGQYFINEADIILCSDDAVFFDPHANAGITSALEPIGLLARGVPLGDVLRWALMGTEERISAQTALRLGIVTEVTPRDELRDRAHAIAAAIAARPPQPVQGTVRAIWESLDLTRSMALRNGMAYTHIGNDYPRDAAAARVNKEPRVR